MSAAGPPQGANCAPSGDSAAAPAAKRGGAPMSVARVFRASAALELAQVRGNRAFVALTALAAVSFLVMVSLFGLTGSYAPVALIDRDGGPYAQSFVAALDGAHHSFALKYMPLEEAEAKLLSGRLVGIITIP